MCQYNLKREFKHGVACSSTGLSEARKFFCQLVTQRKLIDTGLELGLGVATVNREVQRMVQRIERVVDGLIAEMTAEYQSHPLLAKATPEAKGAELYLLRTIRHVVIADMLAQVK